MATRKTKARPDVNGDKGKPRKVVYFFFVSARAGDFVNNTMYLSKHYIPKLLPKCSQEWPVFALRIGY